MHRCDLLYLANNAGCSGYRTACRSPFQGDDVGHPPRAEALGCSIKPFHG